MARFLFLAGVILDGLSLLQRVWRCIKMVDIWSDAAIRIFLEFGILIMILICGYIIISKKIKEYDSLKQWLQYPDKAFDPKTNTGYHNLASMIISEINLKIKP